MNRFDYEVLKFRMSLHRAFFTALPRIAMATKIFKRPIVGAYKDSGGWFISDFNGFSKAQNQLVDGVPELIEHFVGASTKIRIQYSSQKFPDAIACELIETNPSGSTYLYRNGGSDYEFWLCPVFFWYFRKAPELLFVSITAAE
jgi:hypothetical protein